MAAAVVSETLVSVYRVSQKNCAGNEAAATYRISLEKLKFIRIFEFEINCLNISDTPCASQYGDAPRNITVLDRKLHGMWELQDNITVDAREMSLWSCRIQVVSTSTTHVVLRDDIVRSV